ncbi:MAG: T9SS type B sorting domain-containing protein, partial [Paludibacteraceae bacterium]|nr:T9SS type B sorting domain-containing protein [Paludibacteraceae bacterium]
ATGGNLLGTDATYTPATAGTYYAQVTNTVDGCHSDRHPFVLTEKALPLITDVTASAAVCAGGDITFTATEIEDATYTWTGDAHSSSHIAVVTGVTSGTTYSGTVTAFKNGCESLPVPYTQTAKTTPVITEVTSAGVCEGGDLTFTATEFAGGTYTWTGALTGLSTTHVAVVSGVESAHTYSGTVAVQVEGCDSKPFAFSQRTFVTPMINKVTSTPVCEGGTITFTVSASDADHYQWTGDVDDPAGQTTRTASVSQVGSGTTYSGLVTAYSAEGCPSEEFPYSQTSFVTPEQPDVQPNDGCDKLVRFEIANYDPSCSYTWQLNGAPLAVAGTYYTLPTPQDGATYAVRIQSKRSGCVSNVGEASQTYKRTPPMPAIRNNTGCNNPVRFTIDNYAADLDYVWRLNGNDIQVTGAEYELPLNESVDRTIYTMEISSSRYGECVSAPSSSQQQYMINPKVRLESPDPTCFPTPIDLQTSVVESTADAVQFFLDPKLEHSVGNNLVQQIGDNTFYALGINMTGCHSDTVSVVLSIFDLNVGYQRLFEICNGEDLTMSFVGLGTQARLYRYTVDDPDGKAVDGINHNGTYSVHLTPEMSGSYHLEVSNGACELRDDVAIVVYEKPAITASQIAPETGSVVQVTIDNGPFSYYLDESDIPLQDTVFTAHPGKHLVTVYDANNCYNSVELVIDNTTLQLKIPTFFTPNGDDENDTWLLENLDVYPTAKVEIYNRYHKVVASFGATDYPKGWDGSYHGHLLPSDDYWYMIKLPEIRRTITGHVTIYRGERR